MIAPGTLSKSPRMCLLLFYQTTWRYIHFDFNVRQLFKVLLPQRIHVKSWYWAIVCTLSEEFNKPGRSRDSVHSPLDRGSPQRRSAGTRIWNPRSPSDTPESLKREANCPVSCTANCRASRCYTGKKGTLLNRDLRCFRQHQAFEWMIITSGEHVLGHRDRP
jgi:hypothetical protein